MGFFDWLKTKGSKQGKGVEFDLKESKKVIIDAIWNNDQGKADVNTLIEEIATRHKVDKDLLYAAYLGPYTPQSILDQIKREGLKSVNKAVEFTVEDYFGVIKKMNDEIEKTRNPEKQLVLIIVDKGIVDGIPSKDDESIKVNFLDDLIKSRKEDLGKILPTEKFEVLVLLLDHKDILTFYRNNDFKLTHTGEVQFVVTLTPASYLCKALKADYLQIINEIDATDGRSTSIFGLAEQGGIVSIVYTKRMNPKFYKESYNWEKHLKRIRTASNQEIGHNLGLEHCFSTDCCMKFYSSIRDLDWAGSTYCSKCRKLLQKGMEKI